ncbi:hypothetical protein Tco_0320048 [Tanacetum coccineum]
MVKRAVEIETVGEGVDEIDKLAELTDEMQLKQEDQGCFCINNFNCMSSCCLQMSDKLINIGSQSEPQVSTHLTSLLSFNLLPKILCHNDVDSQQSIDFMLVGTWRSDVYNLEYAILLELPSAEFSSTYFF